MRLAVVDVGTITTRLLLQDTDDHTRPRGQRFQPITQLGEGRGADGRLQPAAIDRVVQACGEHRARLDAFGPDMVSIVATAAVRQAPNRDAVIEAVQDALGQDVRVLSGTEEGELAFHGAVQGLPEAGLGLPNAGSDLPDGPFVLVDIGGGSTEFTVGTSAGPDAVFSADIGAASVTATYLDHDPPRPEELSAALSVVQLHLDDARRELDVLTEAIDGGVVIGVGGTLTTVTAVEIGLEPYDADQVHGFWLDRAAAEDVFRTLATESRADRAFNPGLPQERVDLIVGGCVILVELMRHLTVDRILVSECDLLDGVAAELAASSGR